MSALSTAGTTFKYAVEATAGTRPTTSYTLIPGVKNIPEVDSAPSALDSTDLSATVSKTSIAGLKDAAGSQAITANMSNDFKEAWEDLCTAAATAKAAGKAVWFEVHVPGMDDSVFFTAEPSPLGLNEVGVDSVFEAKAYLTITNEPIWETKIA